MIRLALAVTANTALLGSAERVRLYAGEPSRQLLPAMLSKP